MTSWASSCSMSNSSCTTENQRLTGGKQLQLQNIYGFVFNFLCQTHAIYTTICTHSLLFLDFGWQTPWYFFQCYNCPVCPILWLLVALCTSSFRRGWYRQRRFVTYLQKATFVYKWQWHNFFNPIHNDSSFSKLRGESKGNIWEFIP